MWNKAGYHCYICLQWMSYLLIMDDQLLTEISSICSVTVAIVYSLLPFQPGEFIHTLGDAHIYLNHVEPLKVQVSTHFVFLYFIFHSAHQIPDCLNIVRTVFQMLICMAFFFFFHISALKIAFPELVFNLCRICIYSCL